MHTIYRDSGLAVRTFSWRHERHRPWSPPNTRRLFTLGGQKNEIVYRSIEYTPMSKICPPRVDNCNEKPRQSLPKCLTRQSLPNVAQLSTLRGQKNEIVMHSIDYTPMSKICPPRVYIQER